MLDALVRFADLAPDLLLTFELRVSSGLVLAGLLGLWLWRRHSGRGQ